MNKRRHAIECAAIFAFILVGMAGCRETEPCSGSHSVSLEISLKAADLSTRSAFDDASEAGEDFGNESRIDKDDLFIALYDVTGKLTRVLYDPSGISGERGDQEFLSDNLELSLSLESDRHATYTVAALANFKKYISEDIDISSLSDLVKTQYTYPADSESNSVRPPLPMFGTQEIDMASVSENERIPVDLKRLLAKIKITDSLNGEWHLSEATLCNFASHGYINTEGTNEFSEPDKTGLKFLKGEENEKAVFYAYLPEMTLGEAGSDLRKVTLSLKNEDNEEKFSTLFLTAHNSAGKPEDSQIPEGWDALRANHQYLFNITSFSAGGSGGEDDDIVIDGDYFYIAYWVQNPDNSGDGPWLFNSETYTHINFTYDLFETTNPEPLITPYNKPLTTEHVQMDYLYGTLIEIGEAVLIKVTKDEIGKENFSIRDLNYQWLRSNYERLSKQHIGSLLKNAERIEKRNYKGEEATFIWLNEPSLGNFNNDEIPQILRIYIKPFDSYKRLNIDIVGGAYIEDFYSQLQDSPDRNYKYFEVRGNIKSYIYLIIDVSYNDYNYTNLVYNISLSRYAIYKSVIDSEATGEEIYVFYAN